ncbi:MAG: dicarboxylate/amino acid:cation symporter [Anaerococcus sp.]
MKFVALFVSLILFYILSIMAKKKVSFGKRVILASILGIAVGYVFKENTEYVGIFGSIYSNLLYSLVVPLLATSVVKTIVSTESMQKLRTIGIKSVGILSLHNVLGSTLGVILAVAFSIGKGSNIPLPTSTDAEVPSIVESIINFFPSNIVKNAANNSIIPIIVFSVLIGVAVIQLMEKGKEEEVKPFVGFINSFAEVIFKVTSIVIKFTPYAVLSLIANAVSRVDVNAIKPLLLILVLTYVAAIIHSYFTTGVLLSIFAKVNPFKFFKKNLPVQLIAFTTQSSIGTIPANIDNLKKNFGVSDKISSFVAPVGATMGMPGCAGFWPAMSAIMTVNIMGMNYEFKDYILLIIVALLVSLGTVGVPGTATIATTAVFATLGLPIEMVVLLSPISSLADMGRTATNVTAASSSAIIVASSENELDRDIYNK